MAFFAETIASFCKHLIRTLVFEKNANIFAENWQKSQKIVIITSTPSTTADGNAVMNLPLLSHSPSMQFLYFYVLRFPSMPFLYFYGLLSLKQWHAPVTDCLQRFSAQSGYKSNFVHRPG
jgi:hypothetical protein